LRKQFLSFGEHFYQHAPLRAGAAFVCLCSTDELQLGLVIDSACWRWLRTGDYCFHGESRKHWQQRKQHAELDDNRRDQHCHYAGIVYVSFRKRLNKRESGDNDDLHAESYQCRRFNYGHGDCHR